MSDCNCGCGSTLPNVKQGDDCYLAATVYFNGVPITGEQIVLLDTLEYCFEEAQPRLIAAEDAWNSTLGLFLLPISQQETLLLESGKTNIDLRVKFRGGNILGARQRRNMKILEANSMEVIP